VFIEAEDGGSWWQLEL